MLGERRGFFPATEVFFSARKEKKEGEEETKRRGRETRGDAFGRKGDGEKSGRLGFEEILKGLSTGKRTNEETSSDEEGKKGPRARGGRA